MNILIIVDKQHTAIDRLAQAVKRHNPHFNIEILPVHPKSNDPLTLGKLKELLDWCDLLDIHYWKSGNVVKDMYPKEFAAKKKIVCHFNPYDYDKEKWLETYNYVVVGNKDLHMKLPYAEYIAYGIDLDFFEFNEDFVLNKTVSMVVNRIESKKGVLEVAQVCKELGYHFLLIGNVSDGAYLDSVMNANSQMTFVENATDEQMKELCSQAAVHVCNSVDNFETGTLPILENMAMGVPVLTRNIGHVPDLFDGNNMVVRKGQKEDLEDLKTELREMVENKDRLLKIREAGFKTVKNFSDQHMARAFSRLYYRIMSNMPLVSVIIPTKNRGEKIIDCLVAAVNQKFENYEVVVADSGESIEPLIIELRKKTRVPIRYIHFTNEGYSLAEARNRAVIEAQGKILVFCDDRLEMDSMVVDEFGKRCKQKCWLWGVKDEYEKPFVENLSCLFREDLIDGGMFLERMAWYGGMSQEIRTRFSRQGFAFEMVREAKAKSITRSGDKAKKRKDLIKSKFLLHKLYG